MEAFDKETEQSFWRLASIHLIDTADYIRAIGKLLEYNRPYSAINFLSLIISRGVKVPPTFIVEMLERVLHITPEEDLRVDEFSYNIVDLLKILEQSADIDENLISKFEWEFLPLLERHGRKPKKLHLAMQKDPDFFVEIMTYVFPAEGENLENIPEEAKIRAQKGYDLLGSWRTLPGIREDGILDGQGLLNWILRAREALAKIGRVNIGDDVIGKMLSGSPVDPDGIWPHTAVRCLIEAIASDELEEGIEAGVINNRGATSRSITEGGAQEHRLADNYAGFATVVRDRWLRTSTLLNRISDHYRMYARHQDRRAELRQDLGH